MRARTRDPRKIDTALACEPTCERSYYRTACKRRRAKIALGCANRVEGIHWRSWTRHRRGMHRRCRDSRRRAWRWCWSLRRGTRCGWRTCRDTRPRNNGYDRADFRYLAHAKTNFRKRSAGRRWHFHRGFVGLDFEQVVARLYRIAGGLEPFRDFAFDDSFAELRHQNVHANLQKGPVRLTTSPTRIAFLEIPSCLPGRLRARGRIA